VILVTGGAGFIGASFILDWLRLHDEPAPDLDVSAVVDGAGLATGLL
jgi:dTDP-D-glucose 4,6-dehydratase